MPGRATLATRRPLRQQQHAARTPVQKVAADSSGVSR